MAVCRDVIPYSHFMGGPLVWTDLDRALAVEWRKRENERCRGCGTSRSDWYLDDGTPDDTAFRAQLDRCPGCEHLASVDLDPKDKGQVKRIVPNEASDRWRNYGRG